MVDLEDSEDELDEGESMVDELELAEHVSCPVSPVNEVEEECEDDTFPDSDWDSSMDDFVDTSFQENTGMSEETEMMCVEYVRRCVVVSVCLLCPTIYSYVHSFRTAGWCAVLTRSVVL